MINSERPGFEWLQTFFVDDKLELGPDLIICDPCFYEARAQPNTGENLIEIQDELLGNGKTLLYGIKAGHPQLHLSDIHILVGKKNAVNDSNIGQAMTYAAYQARLVSNPAFHRMALFDREKFYLLFKRRRIYLCD